MSSAHPARISSFQTTKIPLDSIPAVAPLALAPAQLFVHPELPFAIVQYAMDGVENELGLPLDLDKRIFLDHFDAKALEAAAAAPLIVHHLFGNYFRRNPAPLAASANR